VDIDSAGFAEFYEKARDDCLRAVFASVGDLHASEDLVAEAFARAWARWRTVGQHPAPQAWVVKTALNARVSWWRRSCREVTLPDLPTEQADSIATIANTWVDGSGAGAAVDRDLMAALQRLSVRQREVIALRLFLDLDTTRTAQTLGIAPGTVTAHLARAIAALREEFTSVAQAAEQEQP
jgi:RNA polymerase sigma-70 factor (ECF subfamily)